MSKQTDYFDPSELSPDFTEKVVGGIEGQNPYGKNSETFFSKKKKKFIFLWSILFIFIIFIAVKFLLNLSFIEFVRNLSQVSNVSYFFATIVFGFLSFVFCEIYIRVLVLKEKFGNRLKSVTKFEWISFSIISFIIQSITPFSLGSEPYSIWWLNKRGISLKEAGAVVSVTSFCWFVGQFLITWPSFIYITVQNWDKISTFTIAKTYWAILIGLFVDIGVAMFIFAISYAKKVHYYVSVATNNIKRYFGFNYLTRDEIVQKYIRENTFQKIYVSELKKKNTLKVIFYYLINNLWVYLLFVFIHRLFLFSSWTSTSAFNSYHLINVATTANNFLPLPSAEGSLQIVIQNLLSGLPVVSDNDGSSIAKHGSVIFLWRFFNKYLGIMIGGIFISIYGFNSKGFKSVRKLNNIPFLSKNRPQTSQELVF